MSINRQSIDFFKNLTAVRNLGSEVQKRGSPTSFEILAHVIQHGLQEFMVKNIEGESTEAKAYFVEVGLLR